MKDSNNPYLLLTPGPLSTSAAVKQTMLRDWCTWDDDYNLAVVQNIRARLEALASKHSHSYTSVLLQGSGSFAVEATLGSFIGPEHKVLIIENGSYGNRIVQMCSSMEIAHVVVQSPEHQVADMSEIRRHLDADPSITHIALVHCETTSGILNPVADICRLAKQFSLTTIVDAMSSFGGIPIDMAEQQIDLLISSANKCIQGVPGFAFVIGQQHLFEQKGFAKSVCFNLHDQWRCMHNTGKWRFTSPTHTVRAFLQALQELEEEGGITARYQRYRENHRVLVDLMEGIGFKTLVDSALQSPIITTFKYPNSQFDFLSFYTQLKNSGFVIYPGKVTNMPCFRIGHIGTVTAQDMRDLCAAIQGLCV
jgi:2-aminoethylphosphonate-pyruvate transaminase